MLHNNQTSQFYDPFSTTTTPTHTHLLLKVTVCSLQSRNSTTSQPVIKDISISFHGYIIHSWQRLRNTLLTINKFDFFGPDVCKILLCSPLQSHIWRLFLHFKADIFFINLGPVSEVYQDLTPEKLGGNFSQPGQNVRKARDLNREKENRIKFVSVRGC